MIGIPIKRADDEVWKPHSLILSSISHSVRVLLERAMKWDQVERLLMQLHKKEG